MIISTKKYTETLDDFMYEAYKNRDSNKIKINDITKDNTIDIIEPNFNAD